MSKQLKKNKKKKGFTLIELVIVLAVLAVIAVIAIPNFTKVRNNALIDSDYRAAESIEKITLMGRASGEIENTVKEFKVTENGRIVDVASKGTLSSNAKDLFRDANGPQVPTVPTENIAPGGSPVENKKCFIVTINDQTGQVQVGYSEEVTFAKKKIGPVLAGPDTKIPTDVKPTREK